MVDTRVVRESSRTEGFPLSEWSRDALVANERKVGGSVSGLTESMCGLSNGDTSPSTTVVDDSRRCGQLSRRATSVVSRLIFLARVPSRDPRREAVGSVIGAKYATPLRATTSNCFLGASAPARDVPLSRFRRCTKAPVPSLVRGRR